MNDTQRPLEALIEHELILLMLNLVQVQAAQTLVSTFVEACNSMAEGTHLVYFENGEAPSEAAGVILIPVHTLLRRFGYLQLTTKALISPTQLAIWHNASGMLALLLERLEQRQTLLGEAERLELLIAERTRDLEEKNQQLTDGIQQFEQAEHQAAVYLTASPMAIFVTNPQGCYLHVNPAACELLGYSLEEVLQMSVPQVAVPRVPGEAVPPLFKDLSEIGKAKGDTLLRHKNGNLIPIALDATRLPNGNYIAFCQDISERLAHEAELKEQVRKAEAASEAKSVFLSTMSHELRTPMNGVIGMAELLKSEVMTPEQLAEVGVIIQSGQSLVATLNDILEISRIEAERLELLQEEFFLKPMLDQCLSLFEGAAKLKGIELKLNLDPKVGNGFVGDSRRLEQVLTNLLGNAIKFTNKGSVDLRVTLRAQGEGDQQLRFEVLDTGVGVSPVDRDLIFERFHQLDGSLTRRSGGVGLGLAIVKGILEAMNSQAELNSEPGLGSCFYFDLTLPQSDRTVESPESSTPLPEPSEFEGKFNGMTCLLVEDDEVNLYVLRRSLRYLGFDVIEAINGKVAVDWAHRQVVDLILMDVWMPVMDGLEATRKIRNLEGYTKVPVLGVTAKALPGDQKSCIDAGMNAYLTKPLRFAQLCRSIDQLLSL
ncbi:MAG: ATP-binding protein [bacterium]|nr:ATP-binding protein [bacterium]